MSGLAFRASCLALPFVKSVVAPLFHVRDTLEKIIPISKIAKQITDYKLIIKNQHNKIRKYT